MSFEQFQNRQTIIDNFEQEPLVKPSLLDMNELHSQRKVNPDLLQPLQFSGMEEAQRCTPNDWRCLDAAFKGNVILSAGPAPLDGQPKLKPRSRDQHPSKDS